MKIVCFGDSVTRGISYIQGRLRIVKENYPTLLQRFFNDDKQEQVEVVNKGVFNDNSDLLVQRLEKDVLSLTPNYVLIEIGGNDCNFFWDQVAQRPEDEHEPIVEIKRYLQNIQILAERIKQEKAVPILLSLLPLDPKRYYEHLATMYQSSIAHWISRCGGIEHWHSLYNRELKQFVQRMGTVMIDIRTMFKQKGDLQELLSDDGIHPSPIGYSVLSECIVQGLSELGIV